MRYFLICKDGNDTFALLKENGKTYKRKYHISDSKMKYWRNTGHGYISNISTDEIADKFDVIYQYQIK